MLLLEGLRGAAQRPQVLQHALGIGPPLGALASGRARAGDGRRALPPASPPRSRRDPANVRSRALLGCPEAPPRTGPAGRGLVALGTRSIASGASARGDQVPTKALARASNHYVCGRRPDPPPGRLDRPPERLRVARVDQQRQIRQRVSDLRPLIQAERAEQPPLAVAPAARRCPVPAWPRGRPRGSRRS